MASKRKRPAAPAPAPQSVADDVDCYTLKEFCLRNRISESMYYKLRRAGQAPVEMRVGSMILISKEAAIRWRAERERAA